MNDEKTKYAVVKAIEVIGEAVKNIPLSIRNENSNVPWKDIAGMRDKLMHQYVKNCFFRKLPTLIREKEKIILEHDQEPYLLSRHTL